MHRRGTRLRRVGGISLTLGLACLLALSAGGAAAAKKKGKKPQTFSQTKAVNAAVPNGNGTNPSTPVTSTITVPKSFKGRVVGDVDVTGITTTGSGVGAANDLAGSLTAPNGRTITLFDGLGDISIGPLTLDDDTSTSICDQTTPVCESPGATLLRPFAGTANLYDEGQTLGVSGTGPLSAYNGTPMRGTWTLTVWDEANAPTSTLNSWGLKLRAAKPVAAPGKGAGTFSQTKLVNALVPDEVAAGASTPLISTLVVPKKFKGLQVGDVNLTGFTTTGNITGAAADLRWRIIAPNGRTITIGENSNGDVSIGPLTLDEDVKTGICDSNTLTCSDPYQTLIRPFAGTANTQELGVGGSGNLTALDGVPMRGTWTFLVWDEVSVGEISTLNSWGLKLTAAKPVRG